MIPAQPSPPPPRTARPAKPPRVFAREAARASWIAPLIGLAVVYFAWSSVRGSTGGGMTMVLAVGLEALFLLAGLVLAIVGLAGIPRHGTQGILAPALAGLVLSGIPLVLLFALLAGMPR